MPATGNPCALLINKKQQRQTVDLYTTCAKIHLFVSDDVRFAPKGAKSQHCPNYAIT